MSRPQNIFELFPNPKNSPLGPKKVKNDPKIKSKSIIRMEGSKENKSLSRPQNNLNLTPTIKIAYFFAPKKPKKNYP